MKNKQNLGKSQFILTFGPGSIIESVNGPRLIPSLRNGFRKTWAITGNEVENIRMVGVVRGISNYKNSIKFFRLPDSGTDFDYDTYIFPTWKICYESKKHKSEGYLDKPILYQSSDDQKYCPICGNSKTSTVRFICACPKGHMDEVNWHFAVHNHFNCQPRFYYWDSRSSSLADIFISCPDCPSSTNMKKIYERGQKCKSRFPEDENVFSEDDSKHVHYSKRKFGDDCGRMTVIQRQSTSLRIPYNITLLQMENEIDNIRRIILDYNELNNFLNELFKEENPEISHNLICALIHDDGDKKTMENFIKSEGIRGLKKYVITDADAANFNLIDLYLEEFEILTNNDYINGDNLIKSCPINKPININNDEFTFSVSKVNQLRTVTAQIGYYRLLSLNKDGGDTFSNNENYKDIGYKNREDRSKWYPVVESDGEGIFITSDDDPFEKFDLQEVSNKWIENPPTETSSLFGDVVKNPKYVWWHSFSHALIRTLSYKSGYNSASIRERVYFDENNGKGGVLLYTSNVGGDGSLGGLIGLVDNFDEILSETFESVKSCSYDPLCIESEISKDRVNGAACLYCLLLPETSCEHNNKWLDRHILLGE